MMNITKLQKLKIKAGLLEPELNIGDINIGDTVYLYNMISGEIKILDITLMSLDCLRFMSVADEFTLVFKSEEQAQSHKDATDEINKILDKETMKNITEQFKSFADVSNIRFGDSCKFTGAENMAITSSISGVGTSRLLIDTIDHPIIIRKELPVVEADEMDSVIKFYKNRK